MVRTEASTEDKKAVGSTAPSCKPRILAPAGDMASFLAAMAAGADAAYVGLKNFSARAGADNFSIEELARMTALASAHGRRINIAFNTMVKPDDMLSAARLMKRLARDVKPHALIIQDPGLIDLARQAGFEGELHLSTLANLSHAKALQAAKELGAKCAVLPREINIDEIRSVCASCPEGLDLELFVHGAVCYCVSGRCYWSSYMGGKSSLRGRCVQPCRRMYAHRGSEGRYFSCKDLSLDVLVRSLLDLPQIRYWKIEGRRKGPHYVYHTALAYRILRDEGSAGKKEAEALLEMSLGRPSTHGIFLPQRPQEFTDPNEETSSGMLVGHVRFEAQKKQAGRKQESPSKERNVNGRPDETLLPLIRPHIPLLPKDLLRIGYEDDSWYDTIPVNRRVPKAGTLFLRTSKHKTPKAGTPVFLIDRREEGLVKEMSAWQKELDSLKAPAPANVELELRLPAPVKRVKMPNIHVRASLPKGKETRASRSSLKGLWLSRNSVKAVSRTVAGHMCWLLPPVIWPDEEDQWQKTIAEAAREGSRTFVCNAQWQIRLFDVLPDRLREGLTLIAGPFCNVANAAHIGILRQMGFHAAVVSPELTEKDYLALPRSSCLPLGIVTQGFWPVGISRHKAQYVREGAMLQSPKGEQFWTRVYGENMWVYPAWPLDLSAHEQELDAAGYSFKMRLDENCPEEQQRRTSEFNWNGRLL